MLSHVLIALIIRHCSLLPFPHRTQPEHCIGYARTHACEESRTAGSSQTPERESHGGLTTQGRRTGGPYGQKHPTHTQCLCSEHEGGRSECKRPKEEGVVS
jgi:hypothetical protein